MVFFNYSTMQMTAKVVYYGPGLCGKTTNLQFIYGHTANDSRGEMVSLETETDRTLFFDLLPIDVGTIGGFSTRIQLYTVPGQVFYNTTRKLVLKGVDGVVFVADSQKPMLQANVDSWKNLEENLAEMGLAIDSIPVVLQYNKRDLPDVSEIDELNRALNPRGLQHYEASAVTGQGVFETLKGISKLTLLSLKKRLNKMGEGGAVARPTVTARTTPLPPAAPAAGGRAKPTPPPPSARPAAAPPAQKAARGGKASKLDVLAELEKIRKQALSTPGMDDTGARAPRSGPHARVAAGSGAQARTAPPAAQGNGEIHRSVEFTLKRAEFHRARRFLLDLRVEDENARVVDAIRDIPIDINDPSGLERLLLHLKVALNSKD
jgi:signal recognition particle receptor subunit beta